MISRNRHIRKDYQLKNLRNPFFQKKVAGKRRFFKWFLLLGIFALGAIIWFFLAAPFWNIGQIQLAGLSRAPEGEVERMIWAQTEQSRWMLFSERNIFLFDSEQAEAELVSTYNLTGSKIKKKWPRSLEISGFERPNAFIWQEGNQLFYTSRDGYVIPGQTVSEDDKQKYFILENKNPGTLIGQDNKLNVNSDYLGFAFKLEELIRSEPDLRLARYILDWEFNTLKIQLQDGPLVYFSTKDDPSIQLERLMLVKKEKIKDNFSRTDYIDLRFGDKIFINPDFN